MAVCPSGDRAPRLEPSRSPGGRVPPSTVARSPPAGRREGPSRLRVRTRPARHSRSSCRPSRPRAVGCSLCGSSPHLLRGRPAIRTCRASERDERAGVRECPRSPGPKWCVRGWGGGVRSASPIADDASVGVAMLSPVFQRAGAREGARRCKRRGLASSPVVKARLHRSGLLPLRPRSRPAAARRLRTARPSSCGRDRQPNTARAPSGRR